MVADWARARGSRRRVLHGAGVAMAAGGTVALAACGVGGAPAAPAKKVRTSVSTVRFMALGSGSGLQWQLQAVDRFNQAVGAEQKITVKAEPEADQTALFTKFQTTSAAGD